MTTAVAHSLDLATMLVHEAKYAEADPLYRQALAMWQKVLGPEHPKVALCRNNLAAVLSRQGKLRG